MHAIKYRVLGCNYIYPRCFSARDMMIERVNLQKVFWKDLQHQLTKVPCPLCSRVMRDERSLKNHMKLHENTCKDCGKCFSSAPRLSQHKYRAHVPNVCDHCHKPFKSPQDLQRHIDTVHLKRGHNVHNL